MRCVTTQRLSNEELNRLKNPLRSLASLPAELLLSFLDEPATEVVQLPAPPRPTCQTAPCFIFSSRVLWRSSSSSKEKIAFSEDEWMLPAPPRPELNFELVWGRPVVKREAGPEAVAPSVVLGALKVLPAPPRPLWM